MSAGRADRRRSIKRDRKEAVKQSREELLDRWTPFVETETITQNHGAISAPVTRTGFQKCFVNNRYLVLVRRMPDVEPFGMIVHLSIRRNDRGACRDWRDFQRIKNELVGAETEAVEIFPAESRLVDAANQFHLWCFPKYKLPFGFQIRDVRGADETMFGASQRPFEED
jgi:hypothetical protein